MHKYQSRDKREEQEEIENYMRNIKWEEQQKKIKQKQELLKTKGEGKMGKWQLIKLYGKSKNRWKQKKNG